MTVRRRRLAACAATGALALYALTGTAFAGATASPTQAPARQPASKPAGSGTPGYCPSAKGVTVVVDFQELGGGIVVRCALGPVVPGFTGLDALQGAGFNPAGTQRWGLQFVCRIAGEPTRDQKLPIQGDPNYREACVDTPPVGAFWSYWYATNGGSWTYSSAGPMNRDAIPGGFEGWSFSLNHSQGSAPAPGIAPIRPPHTPPTTPPPTTPPHRPPTHRPPTHRPPTHAPATHQPSTYHPASSPPVTQGVGAGGSAPTSPVTTGGPSTAGTAGARGTETTTGTTGNSNPVAVGHNAAGEKVSGALPAETQEAAGSSRGTVIGLCVVVLLGIGGGAAVWRRRAGPGAR